MPVNALRYSSGVRLTTSVSAGPDVTGIFKPAGNTPQGVAPVDEIIAALINAGNDWNALNRRNNTALSTLGIGIAGLRDLVANSDVIFGTQKAEGIIPALRGSVHDGIVAAQNARWEAADLIYANLKSTQQAISEELLGNTPPSDALKTRLNTAETNWKVF